MPAVLPARLMVLSLFAPTPTPPAYIVKGIFNKITYVCATAHSITLYCLFVIPWELIIKVTKWKDRALFNAGTISLHYMAFNSTVCSDSPPPGPALALKKVILWYRFNITGLRRHAAKTEGYEIVFSGTTMCGTPLMRGKAVDLMARLGVLP